MSRAVNRATRGTLDSRKDLLRTAEALKEFSDIEERLRGKATDLSSALQQAQLHQQQQLAAVAERAQNLADRTEEHRALLVRYEEIQSAAIETIGIAQTFMAAKNDDGATTLDHEAVVDNVDQVLARVNNMTEQAHALINAAKTAGFEEIVSEAHGLEQRLMAGRNKLGLLRQSLG